VASARAAAAASAVALAAVRIVLRQRCSREWHQEEQYRRERRSLLAGPTDERASGLLLRTSAASETGYLGVRFRPDFRPGNAIHERPFEAVVSHRRGDVTHLGFFETRFEAAYELAFEMAAASADYHWQRRSLLVGPVAEQADGSLLHTSPASETGYVGVRIRPDFLPGNSDHFEPYQALVSYSGEGTTHLGYYATRAQAAVAYAVELQRPEQLRREEAVAATARDKLLSGVGVRIREIRHRERYPGDIGPIRFEARCWRHPVYGSVSKTFRPKSAAIAFCHAYIDATHRGAGPTGAREAGTVAALRRDVRAVRAGAQAFAERAEVIEEQLQALAVAAAMPAALDAQAAVVERAALAGLKGLMGEHAAQAALRRWMTAFAEVSAEMVQKLGPYSAECYWHYLYKSPPPAKCCWFPPAMAAARTAPDAAAAVAAASAVVEGIEEGRKRTRGAIQARKEAALRAEGERKKEARLAAASAEVVRRKADAAAGLPEHEQLQSAALKEEEEAAMAAAQADAASAAVWRRKQARALLFARPDKWGDETVVGAANVVQGAMRARLASTGTTSGHMPCMKLEWLRDIIREWNDARGEVVFTEAMLQHRVFCRLARTSAYCCFNLREAAALICTGRLTLWIRARQFLFGPEADAREAVAIFAALGAQSASLYEYSSTQGSAAPLATTPFSTSPRAWRRRAASSAWKGLRSCSLRLRRAPS